MAVAWRGHLTLREEYLGWLAEGRKSTTIRWRPGALDLPCADVLPLYAPGRDPAGHAAVVSLAVRRYGDLGFADAHADGFASLAEMRAALAGIYPGLADGDWVTVYGLSLLPGGAR